MPEKEIRELRRAFKRAGEPVVLRSLSAGGSVSTSAVVQEYHKNFRRARGGDERLFPLGGELGDYVMFFAADAVLPVLDRFDDPVISWRGNDYVIINDATIKFGDEPIYIWALVRKYEAGDVGYYDDIDVDADPARQMHLGECENRRSD